MLSTVKELLNLGADVNIANNSGITPLMLAAIMDWSEAAQLLLESGAEVDLQSSTGTTALASKLTAETNLEVPP